MKFIWEAKDITPGRRYSKGSINEKWIIGYLLHCNMEDKYVSISDQDFMVTKGHTKEELAKILTENEYMPVELL